MKVFRVTYRDSEGKLQIGDFVLAPDMTTAISLVPGHISSCHEEGHCIAIHQEVDVTPQKRSWLRLRESR